MASESKHDEDLEVDVVGIQPIFCSSDEENEDENALQYLPIAPEVEDPDIGKKFLENSPQISIKAFVHLFSRQCRASHP